MTEPEPRGEVCVTFRLSRAEFEGAMHHMFWKFWQCSITVYAGVLLLALGSAMALLGAADNAIPALALALVCLAGGAWIYWVSPGRQFRAHQRAGAEQSHCFSKSGSTAHFIDAETRLAWSLYGEIRETREAYLLRLENRAMNIIPKRAFKSSADEATFRDLAQRYTKVTFHVNRVTA